MHSYAYAKALACVLQNTPDMICQKVFSCRVQATPYLNKLPGRLAADDRILVVDPMLATGKPSSLFAAI